MQRSGIGVELHVRDLVCNPFPQLTEHSVKGNHSFQAETENVSTTLH